MNLLSLLQSQLSPQTINQIGSAVGESPDGTKAALGTAVPALLGSLIGKVTSSSNGANEIFNLVKPGGSQSNWFDSVGGLVSSIVGGGSNSAGSSMVSSLLGSKAGAVTDFIANQCGIKGGSASSILSMVAPLIMGTIGKHVASQGLNAGGLSQLLGSQTPYLKNAIPSGLANTLGIGNLLKGTPPTERIETAATHSYATSGTPSDDRSYASKPASNILKYAWVPVVLALGVWLLAHRANTSNPAVGGTTESNQNYVQSGSSVKAPSVPSLSLTPGSTADNLSKALTSGDFSRVWTLQDLSFDNAGNLAESAGGQVQQIGAVLKSTPGVKIRITGYGQTDDAGLSQANTVKSALVATGISGDRINTGGGTGSKVPTLSVEK